MPPLFRDQMLAEVGRIWPNETRESERKRERASERGGFGRDDWPFFFPSPSSSSSPLAQAKPSLLCLGKLACLYLYTSTTVVLLLVLVEASGTKSIIPKAQDYNKLVPPPPPPLVRFLWFGAQLVNWSVAVLLGGGGGGARVSRTQQRSAVPEQVVVPPSSSSSPPPPPRPLVFRRLLAAAVVSLIIIMVIMVI